MSTSAVNDFLLSSKEAFLRNPNDGKTTVVMGNEAGDLDSLASAIAYAWILSNAATPTPAVALIQTPPADLALRPENTHALSLAGVSDPPSALLTPATLPALHPTTPIALVDHNALGPSFPRPGNVIAILDHHADEGQHPNASPRIVMPAGSAASHVAAHLPPHAPKEIAALLLSAILLDTGGLKPGGRALDVDRAAASALAAHAGLLSDALTGEIHETPALRELTGTLEQHKANVAHLTPSQLLRRDYKEYDFVHGGATVRVGLASVPLGLSKWASEGALRAAAETHMQARSVGVLGVLTSFSKEKKDKGKKDKKDKKDKGKKDKEHDEETGEKPGKKDKKEKKDKAHKEGGEEGEKEHAEDGGKKKEEKEKAHKDVGEEGKKEHKEGGEDVKKETAEDGEGKEKKGKAHKEGAEEHEGGKKEKKEKKDKGHKDVGEEGEEGKKEKKEKKDKAHKKDKDVEEDDADAGGEKKEKKDKKDKAHKKDKEHKGEEEDTGKKDKKDKDKKPKHRREMAWLVAPSSSPPSAALAERLWAGLEASTELQVASHAKFTFAGEGAKAEEKEEEKKEGEAGMHTRVYEQGNARANRKVVAPLVRAIIHEGPSAGTGAGAGVGEAGAAASVTAGGVGAATTGAVTGAGAADGGAAAAAAAAADGGAAAE